MTDWIVRPGGARQKLRTVPSARLAVSPAGQAEARAGFDGGDDEAPWVVTERARQVAGATSTQVTEGVRVLERTSDATLVTDYAVSALTFGVDPEVRALDALSQVDGFLVRHVADGDARVEIRVGDYSQIVTLPMRTEVEGEGEAFLHYVEGSAERACFEAVSQRLALGGFPESGSTRASVTGVALGPWSWVPGAANALWVWRRDPGDPSFFLRNAHCWLARDAGAGPVDLSGMAAARILSGATVVNGGAGVLVTRDVLLVTHHHFNTEGLVGATIRFVSMGGTVVERTISASGVRIGTTDLALWRLDTPVPSEILPAAVLTESDLDALDLEFVPLVVPDQEEKALLVRPLPTAQQVWSGRLAWGNFGDYDALAETLIGGDSSSPVCLLHGNRLVLVSTATTPIYGPRVTAEILAPALTELGAIAPLHTHSL